MLPDGTKIKAGGMVTYVPYSMGRMEYNWGPDATSFKPERWFKDGVLKNESPFKFTAIQVNNLTYIFLLTLDFCFFYFFTALSGIKLKFFLLEERVMLSILYPVDS